MDEAPPVSNDDEYVHAGRAARAVRQFVEMPRCARCKEIAVLSPCRACATPEQLAKYPTLPAAYA